MEFLKWILVGASAGVATASAGVMIWAATQGHWMTMVWAGLMCGLALLAWGDTVRRT